MSVPMPAIVVLFVCKTFITGPATVNDGFTGHEQRDWLITNSMMTCRRQEVQLYDPAVDQGATDKPFTQDDCMHAAIRVGVQYNIDNKNTNWRWWRSSCPTPMIDSQTKEIVGWVLPDCGHRDTVICETDSVI